MNKLLPYILTALLALLAGLGALALSGTEPFGSHTLCWQDNGQQVASDFGYVRGVWEGRHALDWSYACGGAPRSSFHPTFNNLVSPLTWAVAAIPGISAVTGLTLLFLLQLTLLPLGALCYLRKTFPRLPAAFSMALALAYAFGGFVLSKYSFLPFLNIAILFPWYLAALDTLLRRGRWLPYCLLLACMLAAGTYFAYMWLLFAAVYAAARTGWRWHSGVRQHTLCLILASAGALLLSAWSWLPSLLVTATSARAGEAHFWWNATRAEPEWMALGYVFSLPFVLAALLGFRASRCNRYSLTLLVLLVGLTCVSASTLWHLSRPWEFAGRFGYMADLMLICMAAGAAERRRKQGQLALALVTCLAALLLGCHLWNDARVNTGYQASADRVRIAEWAAQQVPAPEGRVKSRGNAAVENISLFTPFDSLSHFTACITKEQEETLARWGYQQRTAVISTEGGTLASDTLLGIRYTLSQEKDGAPYRIEENPCYFGMGLMVPGGFLSNVAKGTDPIARQQAWLTQLLGAEHAGTRSAGKLGQELQLPPGNLHYLQQAAEGSPIMASGWPYLRWGGVEEPPRLCELRGTICWLGSRVGKGTDFALYHLPLSSLEALKRYGEELPVRSSYAGYRMHIRCRSTQERNMLFLPLLWQLGYEAEVDGTPTDVFDLGGFVGIPMRFAGEHVVELVYRGWGKWEGALLSLAALPLLLGAWGASRRLHAPRCLDTLCRRLLLGVSFVLLLWPLLTLPIGLFWR